MASDDKTKIEPLPEPNGVEIGTQIIGTYEIREHIAAGGMGEVYRGVNIHTDEPVAIKIVLPSLAHDKKIISLFQKEATVLSRLSHDAIVRYHVFTIDPVIKRPCLIMEFVDGISLASHIERSKAMPDDAVRTMLIRLASGLAKAHRAGVIHRDLSPDNVILREGTPDHATIIDFGIAKSESIGGGTLLGGQFAGKYNFVSPEQLGRFKGQVTERSDIYSLGLVAAAASRGQVLDMGESPADAVENRLTVPDLTDVSEALRPLIEMMLQPDPAHRPENMEAIAAWLQAQAAAEAGQAGQTTTPPSDPSQWQLSQPPVSVPSSSMPPVSTPPGSMPPVSTPPSSVPPQGATVLLDPTETQAISNPPGQSVPPASVPPQAGGESDSPFGPYVPPTEATPDPAPTPPKQTSSNRGRLLVAGFLVAAIAIGGGAYLGGVIPGWPSPIIVASNPEGPDPDPTPVEPRLPTPPDGGDGNEPTTTDDDGDPASTPEADPGAVEPDPDPDPVEPTEGPDPDVPEQPSNPQVTPPSTNPIALLGQRLEWLRNYETGPCTHLRITAATLNGIQAEVFATSIEPIIPIINDYRETHGVEADIRVSIITDAQCPVVDLMKDLSGGADPPRILADQDEFTIPGSIDATADRLRSRHFWIIVVDGDGAFYSTNDLYDPDQLTDSVDIRFGLENPALIRRDQQEMVYLVIVTDEPLEIEEEAHRQFASRPVVQGGRQTMSAALVIRELRKELQERNLNAVADIDYFVLKRAE